MTRWAPFLWLTGVVLVLLLALARLSSGVVRDGGTSVVRDDGAAIDPPPASNRTDLGEPTGPPANGATRADAPVRPPSADPASFGDSPSVEPAAEPPGDPAVNASPTARRPGVDPARSPVPGEPERLELSTWMLLANVALTQGLVGLAIGAGIWWFEIPGTAIGVGADPWIGGLPAVALGLAFGLALWLGNEAAAGIADAVGAAYDEAVRSMLAPNSPGGWAVLLGLVLPTVAVVEELLFRGALIGVPAAGFGVSPWLLAVLSSAAFALGHGAQGRVGIVVTGLLGFVLAAGYVLSGSLVVVIVAHYVVNAMEFDVHEGLGVDRLVD